MSNMKVAIDHEVKNGAGAADAHSPSHTRLHGSWLLLARLTSGIVALTAVVIFAGDLSNRFAILLKSLPDRHDALLQLGMPDTFFADYFILLDIASLLIFCIIAAVIFWRRSDDWMAMFVALALIAYGSINTFIFYAVVRMPAGENLPITVLQAFAFGATLLFLFLFPDGRFIPAWTLGLTVAYAVWAFTWFIVPIANLNTWSRPLFYLALVVWYGPGIFAQVYRYRRISTPLQRQQIKLIVFGSTVAYLGWAGFNLSHFIVPSLNQPGLPELFYDLVGVPFVLLCQLMVPITFGIAIMRYRLWDIDLLINRTLVYVPLTAILAGIFAATITLTQKLFVTLTGQQSDIATVLTTLIVVTAFEPLKKGLQDFVDKRFKEAPDPAKKLKTFGDQLRARAWAVDLRQVNCRLVEEAVAAFGAQGGAAFMGIEEQAPPIYTFGEWKGKAHLLVPIETGGARFGMVALGARRNGPEYTAKDRKVLEEIAQVVAQAIAQDRQIKN